MDDKKFPHGWGDIQYFTRMRKKGWRLMLAPKALVWCEPNTYPAPLNTLSIGGVLQVLFRERRHPLNLQRQFIARWESAPSKSAALAAYAVHLTAFAKNGVLAFLNRDRRA
jgi:GT2 family glycosyltransferase